MEETIKSRLRERLFCRTNSIDFVTSDMTIYKEEIFGPVLCKLRAKSYEEALNLVNNHKYGMVLDLHIDGEIARILQLN